MKITLRIAKLQFINLFYSPISWIVITIFAFYSGTTIIQVLANLEQMSGMMGNMGNMGGFTVALFQGRMGPGYFENLQGILYLFIPLLSMGLISNEINTGTIKLLYSSPVKIRSIVLGKYLAILSFTLVLSAIILVTVFGVSLFIPHLDWGVALPGIAGLLLLTSTYCAIGLFMSSLTRYQVISGIATFAVFFVLDFLGGMAANVPVLGRVLAWLSLADHTENLLRGFLVSSDLLYFIMVSALFLFFTINKMKADRLGRKEKRKLWFSTAAALVATVVVVLIFTHHSLMFYKDFTAIKSNTMNPVGQEIMKKFDDGPLEVSRVKNAVYDRFGPNAGFSNMNTEAIKQGYLQHMRYKPDMVFTSKYFYGAVEVDPDRGALFDRDPFKGEFKNYSIEKKAKMFAYYRDWDFDKMIPMEELDKEAQLRFKSETNGLLSFSYQGKSSYVPNQWDDAIGRIQITDVFTAFKKLVVTPPKVNFIKGHGERRITRKREEDWNRMALGEKHRYALLNNGFNPDEATLKEAVTPGTTDIMIIADPSRPYTEEELQQLKSYIDEGGDLLIAVEGRNAEAANPILNLVGVQVEGDMIMNDRQGTMANLTTALINTAASPLFTRQGLATGAPVSMDGASPLTFEEIDGFEVKPFLQTEAAYTWRASDPAQNKAMYATGLALTRSTGDKEQKIAVVGDADFFADKKLLGEIRVQSMQELGNSYLLKNMFAWFTNGVYPVQFESVPGLDNEFKAKKEDIDRYKLIYIWVLPLSFLLLGTVIWVRRKNM